MQARRLHKAKCVYIFQFASLLRRNIRIDPGITTFEVMKLVILVLLCVNAYVNAQYSLSLSSSNVVVGQSVTVSWTGTCSHTDLTGCYDWIAAFQVLTPFALLFISGALFFLC
jgi:hypothetical protein